MIDAAHCWVLLPHRAGQHEKGKAEGLDVQEQPLMTALFGVLYTLAKEKINDSARIAILNILIDFILIVLLFITPHYPWAASADSL